MKYLPIIVLILFIIAPVFSPDRTCFCLTSNEQVIQPTDQSSDERETSPKISFISSLKTSIIERLERVFSPIVTVFFISMLPIFELRGAIPIGINYFHLDPIIVYIVSVTGNIVPIFFVLLFFDGITILFSKIPLLSRILDSLFVRTRSRTKLIEKYKELALIFFVAIPLPVTGAWTGSLAAYLLKLKFWKSIFCILIGVLIAGVIVSLLSLMGKVGGIIALTVLTVFFLCKFRKLLIK